MVIVAIKSKAISVDREVLSGAPCFTGTRVPVRLLFDYLEGGYGLREFLPAFPTVTDARAHPVLRDTSDALQDIADALYRN